jgi:hypothetical protein
MADEGFLRRWSRLKAGEEAAPAPVDAAAPAEIAAPVEVAPEELPPPPTLADAAALQHDSDFSAFVASNVDAAVRRLAMKKLFSDPHFHGHDGLDIYMGDYTIPSPVSADMFEQLAHSKSVFRKLDDAIEQLDAALVPDASQSIAHAEEAASAPPAESEVQPPAAPPDQEVA